MRRGGEMLQWRRSWLSMFGLIGAPVGMALTIWLQSRMSNEIWPANAGQRGQPVVRRTETVPGWREEVSLHYAADKHGLPKQTTDVTTLTPPEASPDIEPDSTPPRLEDLATRFRENCAACHGDDGTGNVARMALPSIPDFTSLAWQVSRTEVAIVSQIADGAEPRMPSFRHKLSSRQMLELAVYIRTFTCRRMIDNESSVVVPLASGAAPQYIFQTHCIECHQGDGRGDSAMRTVMPDLPDLTSSRWQKSRSDADLARSILEGKGTIMLPMKEVLRTFDVREMVALVRAFEGGRQTIAIEGRQAPEVATRNEPPLAAPANVAARIRAGSRIFRQYCIACHGADGSGKLLRAQMPPIPDFTNSTWQRQRTDPKLVASIMDGKGTLMPANGGRITQAQAREVVAYLRSFGPRTLHQKVPVSASEFEKSFRELERRWNELEKGPEKNGLPMKK